MLCFQVPDLIRILSEVFVSCSLFSQPLSVGDSVSVRQLVQAMLQKQKVREIMADRTVTDVMDRMGLNRTGNAPGLWT